MTSELTVQNLSMSTIATELMQAKQQIIDAGGEITEETYEILKTWEAKLEIKAGNIIAVMDSLDADLAGARQIQERVEAFIKARSNAAKRLKEYLLSCMVASETKRIDTPSARVTVVNGREAVEVIDAKQIPNDLQDEVVSVELKPRKPEILKKLQAGEVVPGCRLVRSDPHLMVK